MKRLSWSKLFTFAALVSLGIVTHGVATAQGPSISAKGSAVQGGSTSLSRSSLTAGRVPATQAPGQFKAWEGFTTTNYLNTEQYVFTPPSASTAAGPVNIITIVNRRIAIYDNPNAIVPAVGGGTRVPQVLTPTGYLPTSEALLDAWLGEAVLNLLCPTGRDSNISCLVDHASVRYDQMQGRFLVLMTVTDTGVETLGNIVTRPRKASWALLISKFSQFPSQGTAGSSDIFITPTPPVGSTSGVNTANWTIYYGDALNGLGATDGFGNTPTGNGTVGQGNINSLPGIKNIGQAMDTTPGHDAIFDCRPSAIAATGVAPTRACYFPTSARLGIDNDNITITSSVINANYFIPAAPTAVPIPTFAGTRVRVLKKGGGAPGGATQAAGLYQKSLGTPGITLTAANQYDAIQANRTIGDYYDLYAVTNTVTGTQFTTFAVPLSAFAPYTLAPILAPLTTGQAPFCEPARVRGRAAASYTNSMTPSLSSQNYIECIVSTQIPASAAVGTLPVAQSLVYVQPIIYTPIPPINQPSNTNFAIPYYVGIVGDGTTALTGMQAAVVEPFVNPSTVPQSTYTGTTGGPALGTASPVYYVGDDRPHEVVFREGHLYNARVGGSTTTFQTPGSALSATVFYDVIQKLQAGVPGAVNQPVLLAKWTNTNAYAPMYEVPANVATAGQTAPINVFPWLEKLFVATSYPQLTASDPRATTAIQGIASTGSIATCVASNVVPNIIGGISTATLGYPGLYDMRCGNDVFDNRQNFRDPITGQIVINIPNNPLLLPITPALRGGSSTDPNNGSLWNFGLYAQRRFGGVGNGGQLGSYIANYELAFPTTDPYNNTTALFSDCNSLATCPFFVQVQTAAQLGLAKGKADGTVGLNDLINRSEMARLVILAMMDETAVTNYLNSTGGCTTSFADVAPACAGGQPVPSVTNTTGVNAAGVVSNYWRYIETMRRKKITTGCFVNDAIANFCPTDNLTRGQMAVFLVRAKMSNVYPSVISGCPTPQSPACPGIAGGDNFGLSVGTTPYFTDVTATNSFFVYIQKMYELRITNGTAPVPSAPAYSDTATLKRGELLTFIIRAFFF